MDIIEKNIESYINAAIKHGECTEKGDYKQANKQYKIIQSNLNELRSSEKGINQLKGLMEHQSDYVKLWVSSHLLLIDEKKARRVLIELAKKSGLLGFTAQTTLDEWSISTVESKEKSNTILDRKIRKGTNDILGSKIISRWCSRRYKRLLQRPIETWKNKLGGNPIY